MPEGSVEFVTGHNEEVAADLLHVDIKVHRALRAVDEHRDAMLAGDGADFLDRDDGAERVRHHGDGDHLGARRHQLLEFLEQEIAVLVHGRPLDHGAVPLAPVMPGHDVGMVLHDRDQDLVALADVEVAAERGGDEVVGLGRVLGEDDLVG